MQLAYLLLVGVLWGQDEVDAVWNVLDDDVGVNEVADAAHPGQDPDRQAELGLLAHQGVGWGVAHHDGVGRTDAQGLAYPEGVVRTGLGHRLRVVPAHHHVDVLAQALTTEELDRTLLYNTHKQLTQVKTQAYRFGHLCGTGGRK